MNIPIVNITNEATRRTMAKLNVIHNELGFGIIKIAQMSRRFMGGHGVYDLQYTEKREYDPEKGEEKYIWEIRGGKLEFGDDPFPDGKMLGTGKVYYALDDKEPVPEGALSGAKTGYNREFLATHWGEGFKIVDPEIEKDVKERAEHIREVLEAQQIDPNESQMTTPEDPLPTLPDMDNTPEHVEAIEENEKLKNENQELQKQIEELTKPNPKENKKTKPKRGRPRVNTA